MSDDHENHEEEDKSIVEALSTLGWVEEKEEEEESPLGTEDNLMEQLNLFMNENKKLTEDLNEKNKTIKELKTNVQELTQKIEDNATQGQAIQKLYETIEDKNDEIEKLNKIKTDQIEKITDLTSQIETINSEQTQNQDLLEQLQEKENKIKDLKEQLQYLETDTIQKSKFEKAEVLLEKKDEIITEKEKAIFNIENSLKSANQKIHDLQRQLETFSLLKKDLEKKDERIKQLVVEIEELKQKNITNSELISRLEERLEEAQEKSGHITGKFEVELAHMRNIINGKDSEIKELKEKAFGMENKLSETEKIEEKLLSDIQDIKDDKLKMESELEKKDLELVELKKKIKLMRRDLAKS
ncbi:MAG: hypothetical protein KAT66_09125 [Candidatus Lokiarchaeota archaeon]|nr:hypothetical protein [Candidatus Lokiarchaeota archaeon]